MEALQYLHMQLRLEGKSIIGKDSLRQVEIVPDEEFPLTVIAHLANQDTVSLYDETLSLELHKELTKYAASITFPNINPLLDFLRSQNISFKVGHYKTYLFPSHFADLLNDNVICLSKQDISIQAFGFGNFAEQIYAIKQNGKIVSACVSARENEFCGEAWVFTDPKYRKQGFAQQAVSVWAQHIIESEKVPFYSHEIQIIASANLAERLKLQSIFEEIVISHVNV